MIVHLALFFCGTLGFLISLYFTLVYFDRLKPDHWLVPRVCRMDENTCQYIIRTPYGRVLGVQNSILGLIYYACIVVFAISSSTLAAEFFLKMTMTISVGAFLFSVYLTYSLMAKLKVKCILCFTFHMLNAVIMLLLLAKLSLVE